MTALEFAAAVVLAIVGGAAGAALINWGAEKWRFKANRKALKEDRAEEAKEKKDEMYEKLSEKMDNLSDQIGQMNTKLDKHIAENERDNAVICRSRILRFNDELLHNVKHTKDHFDSILLDLTFYEKYCELHETFENNVTTSAIQNIKTTYLHCMEERSFL